MRGLLLIACAAVGYALGCFSTGLLLSQHYKVDIHALGSKSSGATNMTRVLGPKLGLLTFLGDFGKAAIAVLLGHVIQGVEGALLGGLFVVIGHNWPVTYHFKGGKGVACSIAILLILAPLESLIAGILGILAISLTKYVSLGSLVFLLSSAIIIPFTRGLWPMGFWAILLFLIAVYRHRANIDRLMQGEESKFTLKKQV
jgi:glycerol-3-phosphate acyltransferase PlsY